MQDYLPAHSFVIGKLYDIAEDNTHAISQHDDGIKTNWIYGVKN